MEIKQSPFLHGKRTKNSAIPASVKSDNDSTFLSTTEKQPLKRSIFIWLDPDLDRNEHIQSALKRLEKTVPCALSTNNYDECRQWLMDYNDNKRLFLIVSNKFGKQLVPDIHTLPTITAIYVYCTDRKVHTKWTENHPKVRNVTSDTNKLTQKLLMDARNPKRIKDMSSQLLYGKTPINHAEALHEKEVLEKNEDSQEDGLIEFQFVVVDILKHLDPLATAMLKSLVAMTKNAIFIFNDNAVINFDELPKKTTFLFVSSEFAATMKHKFEQIETVFILENDKNKVDHRERFDNGEDLIFELADKIYQCYKKEANDYLTFGETMMAKAKEEQAIQIHSILKRVYKLASASNDVTLSN